VSKGKVMQAIAQGCGDVASLKAATRASAVCGGCEPALRRLLDPNTAIPSTVPTLTWPSLLGLAFAFAVLVGPGWPMAKSVLDSQHAWEFLWRDGFWHQATGYTLLGIFVTALLLGVRKRIAWFSQWGNLASWRWVHACIGILTLLGFLIHTGGHLGHGWNFVLAIAFASLNAVGAIAGWALSRAEKTGGAGSLRVRKIATWSHILLFWPLPLLIGIHVWSVLAY
jgi:nitrite reductase (NADH) large subunit